MIFGSVCSGIEAASAAWHGLGWKTAWVSEIDPFCSLVLAHHYPKVHNYGDFTQIPAGAPTVSVLVGGTPCQSFSVAGLRGGLDDDRGNLALEFCRLADRLRPRWIVWENVPGALSSNGGRDFGSILGAMGELGYGTAYRVLDAQFFGVPQRRRRVFVVGCLGDWRCAAAVLFERQSLSGDSAPRRETREGIAARVKDRIGIGREIAVSLICGDTSPTLSGSGNRTGGDRPPGTQVETAETLVVVPVHCFDARQNAVLSYGDKTGPLDGNGQTHGVVIPIQNATRGKDQNGIGIGSPGDPMYTLDDGSHHGVVIPLDMRQASRGATMTNNRQDGSSGGAPGTGIGNDGDPAPTVASSHVPAVFAGSFEQNSMGGRGTLGWSEEDVLRPVKPQSDHQMIVTLDTGNQAVSDRVFQTLRDPNGTFGDGVPAIAFSTKESGKDATEEMTPPLRAESGDPHMGGRMAVAYGIHGKTTPKIGINIMPTLRGRETGGGTMDFVSRGSAVRRLTPRECERLQGFPDNYTLIPVRGKPAADGPRYKALGNSMAVPVMRWIGERIQAVSDL